MQTMYVNQQLSVIRCGEIVYWPTKMLGSSVQCQESHADHSKKKPRHLYWTEAITYTTHREMVNAG